MVRFTILVMLLLIAISSQSTVYYVSATGSDSANGLTEGTAWKTLTKVNAQTFVAGDVIKFKKGDGWYGTLIASNDSVTYSTYGTGATPTITGFTTVTAWTNLGSNIWESTSAVSTLSTCNMVAVNGVNTAMGRYPNDNAANSGYLTFQSHDGNTSITSSSLTGTPNWTGAEVVVRPNRWILNRCVISSNTDSTLVFSPATAYEPVDGFGFFIQNDARTLDQQNEWYYNPSTKKLKIYSTSTPSWVQIATIEDLCTITASYITIDGLSFSGSNDELITGNATVRSGIIIKNCLLSFSGSDAIMGLNANNSTLDNIDVTNINNNGIGVDGTGNLIQYCDLSNIGLLPGMGTLIYMGIGAGSATTIQYNTIQNVGYIGISFYGNDILVKNNVVDTYCKVLDDGGGIYTYTGNRTAMTNCRITGNIVLNGIGAIDGTSGNQTSTAIGIYLDNNTKNTEVDNNTVANCNTYGILMNSPSYINVHHNTIYNCNPALRSTAYTGQNLVTNNTVTNNTFVAYQATQNMITLVSQDEVLFDFGTINNNTYARPIANTGAMFTTSQPSAQYMTRTFSQWQSYMNQDANSTISPKSITTTSDIEFRYNATSTAQPVSFSWAGIDTNGVQYSSNPTLQPYSSLVLIKNIPNPTGIKKPWGSGGKMWKTRTGLPIGGE